MHFSTRKRERACVPRERKKLSIRFCGSKKKKGEETDFTALRMLVCLQRERRRRLQR